MKINKKKLHIITLVFIILLSFSATAFLGIAIAHCVVFGRVNYDSYPSDRYYIYGDDVSQAEYPRECVEVLSGKNRLRAYIYGASNTDALIVISPGHTDATDTKLYEITYFVDAGYRVLCFDYTGCYTSEGASMGGYSQFVRDLDAVLDYVESDKTLCELPLFLFGHSMGAYASAAVLNLGHENVRAVIAASGFDLPSEQWGYSIERFTSAANYPLLPFTKLYISLKYGASENNLSAIDGINAHDIPVLVISGTTDEFYGGESPIYAKRSLVTNPNCIFVLKDAALHSGHYDYFLTDAAIEYQAAVGAGNVSGKIDKSLYMEHDKIFMETLCDFYAAALGLVLI